MQTETYNDHVPKSEGLKVLTKIRKLKKPNKVLLNLPIKAKKLDLSQYDLAPLLISEDSLLKVYIIFMDYKTPSKDKPINSSNLIRAIL